MDQKKKLLAGCDERLIEEIKESIKRHKCLARANLYFDIQKRVGREAMERLGWSQETVYAHQKKMRVADVIDWNAVSP